jgi:glyoxylase-like metal-dependent hydrolase (beta-lactamase superfamily II)
MDSTNIQVFTLGELAVNAYLVWHPSNHALIIDAPAGIAAALSHIRKKNLTLDGIVLTHGHFDHIEGLNEIEGIPFYIHADDAPCLVDAGVNCSSLMMDEPFTVTAKPAGLLHEGKTTIGDFSLTVFSTPGHTRGSVSLFFDGVLFSGDTLFCGSVGRTDIPHGSHDALIASITKKIMTLGDEVTVYPGHGPATTIGKERAENPFLA